MAYTTGELLAGVPVAAFREVREHLARLGMETDWVMSAPEKDVRERLEQSPPTIRVKIKGDGFDLPVMLVGSGEEPEPLPELPGVPSDWALGVALTEGAVGRALGGRGPGARQVRFELLARALSSVLSVWPEADLVLIESFH